MLRTWEVRWFFRSDPAPVRRLGLADLESVGWRRDWYAAPVNPACGIKIREGQLQPKLRVRNPGELSLGPVRGKVEQWEKWSLALPEDEAPEAALLAATGWVAVDKRRRLRFFRRGNDGLEVVGEAEWAHCQLEWAEVRTGGEHWWTLGLEAAGEDGGRRALEAVAAHALEPGDIAGSINAACSLSYPAWLAECS